MIDLTLPGQGRLSDESPIQLRPRADGAGELKRRNKYK